MINAIIEAAARNKMIVFIAIAAAVLGGLWSMRTVPLDALPDMSTSGSRGTGVDLHENFGSGTGVALGLGESSAEGDALASGDVEALAVAVGVADETAGGVPQPAIARTAIAAPTSDLTPRS